MKKELITALATVLTSTMVTIPAHAARPDTNAAGIPWDPNVDSVPVGWTQEDADVNVGPIEEDTAIMDAYGGVEKYRASFEIVTPEYFKSVYGDVAKSLQSQVDTTNTETIINSIAVAVNNHFTKDFSVAIHTGIYHAYGTRAYTDYVAEGRLHNSYEPAVLVSTMLNANGIPNDIYNNYVYYDEGIVVKTDDGHYICVELYRLGKSDVLVTTNPPAGMYDTPMYEDCMGVYKEYLK